MRFTTILGVLPATFATFAAAAPGYPSKGCKANPPGGSGGTCNTATDRSCWTKGFDVNTDFYESTPVTGKTREYNWVVTEVDNYVGADGVTKAKAMLINDQFPGPTLYADWGDKVKITLTNKLVNNGTGIHWHGVRQLNSNIMDGAPGLTECPIPPGSSKTYEFLVTQYGTSWYHAHVSAQYPYGVTGSIVFNGPATANYDVDLGAFPIVDWYYDSIDHILDRIADPTNPFIPGLPGSPPSSDNVFFNGTNINPAGAGGEYATVTLTPGLKHRLRLVNPSADNTFTFSIVGHDFTIIETDFVPIEPVTASSVYLGVGQRYDIIIDASADATQNYWMNITYSSALVCGTSLNPNPAAILSYGASGLPTDQGTAPPDSLCSDDLTFSPVVSRSAPESEFSATPDNTLPVTLLVDTNVSKVFWTVNGSAIDVSWDKPVLQFVKDGTTDSLPTAENIITIPESNEWTFWVINNISPIPHPMHLHGHDFLVLGHSAPLANPLANDTANQPHPFDPSTDTALLNTNNPTRRDTTLLPAFGWVVLAFKSDNPGAWLMHCHIAWHVSEGLAVDFLERASEISGAMDLNTLDANCAAWNSYFPSDPFQQTDSGL